MAPSLTLPNLDAPDEDVVSRHVLTLFLAGELGSDRRDALEERLTRDPALQARLEALRAELAAEAAAFRVEVPLARFVEEQEARMARDTRGGIGGLWARLGGMRVPLGGGALLAAAAALVLWVRMPDGPAHDPVVPYDGLKGGAGVGFFVKEGAHARRGLAGEELHPGDQIQFAVRDDNSAQSVMLVGVDGNGTVTMYAVEDMAGPNGAAKGAEQPRLLASSIVLDEAVGPERFFVVYAQIDRDSARRAVLEAATAFAAGRPDLTREARLPLPPSWAQGSIHIIKAAAGGR